jgi:hypothetical protein
MKEIFKELLEIQKMVKLLFDKEVELRDLEYWHDDTKYRAAKYKLEDEIQEIKDKLKKLL